MKFLRYINILAILLIFSPFFQLCTNNFKDAEFDTANEDEQIEIEPLVQPNINPLEGIEDEEKMLDDSVNQKLLNYNKKPIRVIWGLLTCNGQDYRLTGFGMTIVFLQVVLKPEFSKMAILSFLISISVILSFISLFKVFRNRISKLKFVYISNSFILITSFIFACIIFEELNQIKWGFYAYSFSLFILTFMSFLFRKKAFNKKEVANFKS